LKLLCKRQLTNYLVIGEPNHNDKTKRLIDRLADHAKKIQDAKHLNIKK
jgi:hypothetical protein